MLPHSTLADSPLAGHFTSSTLTTPPGTRLTSICPPASSNTVRPPSVRRSTGGYTSSCKCGSLPVTSTNGPPYWSTCRRTSSTVILSPSLNAYGVSHHVHLRSQPASRTKTQGLPAYVDSPWIE